MVSLCPMVLAIQDHHDPQHLARLGVVLWFGVLGLARQTPTVTFYGYAVGKGVAVGVGV